MAIAYNVVPTIEDESDPFCGTQIVQHLIKVLKRFADNENLIYACLQVTLLISAHKSGTVSICKGEMLPVLQKLMEKYPGDKTVAKRLVLWIYWSVVAYKENKRDFMKANVPSQLYNLAEEAKVSKHFMIFTVAKATVLTLTWFFFSVG